METIIYILAAWSVFNWGWSLGLFIASLKLQKRAQRWQYDRRRWLARAEAYNRRDLN